MRTWLFVLLLPLALGLTLSLQQPSMASRMVEHGAGGAQGQKKKAAESAWFGCVLVTATRQSKCGKLEQNTDLNAVCGA